MAIGGTIVVGVITYNKWQEYKAKKSVEKAFSSEHDDVLMAPGSPGTVRSEPTLSDDLPLGADASAESQAVGSGVAVENLISTPERELPVDELIDCPVTLVLGGPVRGDKLLPKLQSLRHVGNKPVHFIGQREDGAWEAISHGGIYHGIKAGVQLANRTSALNEIEYSELITRLRQIADDIDAELDVPDMADVMTTARTLHQFVTEFDAQLSVNVQSNAAPWALHTLLAALARQGFDARPDGRLVMPDGEGGVLFSLSTNAALTDETTSRLTLLLDVPRVAKKRDGFGAMIGCARMLAGRLNGTVVDDSSQPLSDDALQSIAEQVDEFYGHMETANVPAGSTRALRLFS